MDKVCVSCRKPKVDSQCGVCEGDVCRKCRLFLAEDSFPLAMELPDELKHTYYCALCYDTHVEPFRAQYEETAEAAKQVNVIFKSSKSTFRLLRKAEKPISLKNMADRDETILKLAFQAAQAGFNSIVDVEVSSEKVRNEGWQTSAWAGSGLPAEIKSYETDR